MHRNLLLDSHEDVVIKTGKARCDPREVDCDYLCLLLCDAI